MENTNNYNNSSFFLQMALPSPHHFQKGLSFLANADGLFGEEEEFDKIQPFNPSAPQSPQYHVLQRAQIVPSDHKLMPMTADAAAAAELGYSSATPLSPCFESSKQQQHNGEINAFWFSSQAPQTPPIPPARAKPYRVLQKLQYEDRPNAYLMEWRRQVSSDKVVRCQKWHREDRLLSHCRPLVQDFNRKLAEDPTLARDMTQYEVDTVLDRTLQQQQGQEVRYLVRWIGWKDPTWESRDKDLLPAYKELLDEFDTINGVAKDLEAGKGAAATIVDSGQTAGPKPKANNDEDKSSNPGQQHGVNFAPGTDWTKPVKVVRAKRVLSKLDLGKSGRPPLYLLEWPPAGAANRVCEPTRANCSWEQYISLGTRDAIEKFERGLAKGSSSAKGLVHHQAECIRKRRTKGRAISYQVKWVGFKPCDWLTRAQLMPTFGHLIKEFELEELKKRKNIKFSTDFTELKKREIPAELHCRLREITERAWGWKKMEDEKKKKME